MRPYVFAITCAATLLLTAPVRGKAIRLEVVRGEGANNNVSTGAAVSPVVRVSDADGKPIPEALVIFSGASEGPRIEFSGYGAVVPVVTDDSGAAAAPRSRSTGGSGPVTIRVTASHAGLFAQAVIHQLNVSGKDEGARSGEIAIIRLGPDEPAASKDKAARFALRIEDGNGKPIGGASVRVAIWRGGRYQGKEYSSTAWTSAEDGEAAGLLNKPGGRGPLEIVVEVQAGELRATRFFDLQIQ